MKSNTETQSKNQISLLLTRGKTKDALDAAKGEFKRNPSAQAKADLLAAYFARIDQLIERGKSEAAEMTLEVLSSRFPETREACSERLRRVADGSLAPMNDALRAFLATPPESEAWRNAMEKLSREILDPRHLINSKILPVGHFLAKEAEIVWVAFKSATEGKDLGPFQESLRTIGRNSPFAPWRRAIAAIGSFYHNDFGEMNRHTQGLSPETPVYAVRTVLGSLTGHPTNTGSATPPETEADLIRLIKGSSAELFADLTAFLADLSRDEIGNFLFRVEALSERLHKHAPGALPDFFRRIVAWTIESDFDQIPKLSQIMMEHGFSQRDLALWAAQAQQNEDPNESAYCLAEAAFARGREKLSPPEKAWLLRMAAGCLLQSDCEALDYPVGPGQGLETPLDLFKESLRLHYSARTQEMLLTYLVFSERPFKEIEEEALAWHQRDPGEIKPLLVLLEGARRRKAFLKAIKFVDMAEKIDPIHPLVRSARVEVKLCEFEESLAACKLTKAKKALSELRERLSEGDKRCRFLDSLDWALTMADKNAQAPPHPYEMGLPPVVREIVFNNLVDRFFAGRLKRRKVVPEELTPAAFFALAKVSGGYLAVGRPLNLFVLPPGTPSPHPPDHGWDPVELLDLCETASLGRDSSLLFELSGVGLKTPGSEVLRYLFYRGMAWRQVDYERFRELLAAAEVLAKKANDLAFLPRIQRELSGRHTSESPFFSSAMAAMIERGGPSSPPSSEQISATIAREMETTIRAVRAVPKATRNTAQGASIPRQTNPCPNPPRSGRRGKHSPPDHQRKFEF